MCVLGAQRTAAVGAFVKGRKTVQAVDPLRGRRDSFVGCGLWHPSIVDVPRGARSDAASLALRLPSNYSSPCSCPER